MKTIMILGAGVMQIPGIRLAMASGWKVIVVDGNPNALGRSLGHHFEVVDLKDKDGLLAMARRCAERFGLDGVFTAGTDFSSSVAWVAEKLGLPGIRFETAMRATDKCLMREAFRSAGVPSPRFALWTGTSDPVAALRGLEFPLVVKPVDNMGARGVRRVDSAAQLQEACASALPLSRSSRVIIEEFMEGPELSLDAVVYRGEVTVCGIADRHIFFPPRFVEMGHTMPTALDRRTSEGIMEVFTAGIRAIGIDNGAAKGDIKLTPRGPMVGEIAARLSGGYMSGWTFPLSSGVEVTQAAMNIAVGLPPGDLDAKAHRVVAERAFISIPGKVADVIGERQAREVPGIAEVFVRASAGDTVVFPANNVEKCGNVLAVGETREKAVEAARIALGRILVLLEPLREETTTFLFRETGNDAFDIANVGLQRAVAGMPPFLGDPARQGPGQRIRIRAFPALENLPCRDWHGLAAREALNAALDGKGLFTEGGEGPEEFVVVGLFWRAFLRASVQGGRYLLESIQEAARKGALAQFLDGL